MVEQREASEQNEVQRREDMIRWINTLLEGDSSSALRDYLKGLEPEDVAEVLGEFPSEETLRIFEVLEDEAAAVVLDDTDPGSRLQILQKVSSKRLARVLDEMPVDEAADIIEEASPRDREELMELLEADDAQEVEEILSYPEDSGARVMNPDFVSVKEDSDVEHAIRSIRDLELEEDYFYVYVVSEDMGLKGTVPIRKLLTVPGGTLIRSIMDEDVHYVRADEDQEHIAMVIKKYDLSSIPVVDDEDKLVGRITFDDIIDVMDEERGEDISRMTGTIEEEQGTESSLQATQNRLPWLVTCMLGSILTGLVIQMFEVTLAEVIALVSFIPVITATGGNSGVQASTVVVREIALGTMDYSRVWEEVWRQLKVAVSLGIICGMVLSFLASFWKGNGVVGLIVGLSLFLVVIWSNLTGVLIPVLFKRIRIDPAIASGPLITTLNDVVGVFIYLSVATYFLS